MACRVGLLAVVCLSSCEFLLNMCRHLHIALMTKMTLKATLVAGFGILALVTPIMEVTSLSSKSRVTNGKTIIGG